MSDIIKLNVIKRGIKARVPGKKDDIPNFNEFDEDTEIWKRRIEDNYQKGFDEGYQKAYDEIKSNYENELMQKSEEYYNILSTFENELENYKEAFNKIIIQTSKKIAEKIIQREIKDHSTIESILKISLSKVLGANEVIIKLNSNDYKYLDTETHKAELEQNFSKIKFEKDSSIPIGGCVIETAVGNVDGRITTQLNEIMKQLENEIIDKDQ